MSIQEIVLKIKGWAGDYDSERLSSIIKIIIVCLLGLCFGLIGFFIGKTQQLQGQAQSSPVAVIYPPLPVNTCTTTEQQKTPTGVKMPPQQTTSSYVGSKTGKIYYTKDCKGINRIKAENRVYFSTQQEAQSQGRTLSKTCASY